MKHTQTIRIKTAQVLVLSIVAVFSAIRCSRSADNSSGILIRSEAVVRECLPGQLAANDGSSCLYPAYGYCPNAGDGYNPSTGQCQPGSLYLGNAGNISYGNRLDITNQNQFKKLLQDYSMGCSGYNFYWNIGGTNPYDFYSTSGFADIHMASATAPTATFLLGAGATSPIMGASTSYVPMYFSAVVSNSTATSVTWTVNSSIGACFNLGSNSALQMYSPYQGLTTATGAAASYVDALITYRNIEFARVRLQKY